MLSIKPTWSVSIERHLGRDWMPLNNKWVWDKKIGYWKGVSRESALFDLVTTVADDCLRGKVRRPSYFQIN